VRKRGTVERYLTDLYFKFSYPLAGSIFVLLGIALSSGKRSNRSRRALASTLLISFIYYGVLRVGQTLGYNGLLPPFLGRRWEYRVSRRGRRSHFAGKQVRINVGVPRGVCSSGSLRALRSASSASRLRRAILSRSREGLSTTLRAHRTYLRPLVPAREILLLLLGERIDLAAHRRQLERGDLAIDFLRILTTSFFNEPWFCTRNSQARDWLAKLSVHHDAG